MATLITSLNTCRARMQSGVFPVVVALATLFVAILLARHSEWRDSGSLCAEPSREQVELLQMHKEGITLAECWTELPPKAELEQKLHAALPEARERLERRGEFFGDLYDE